MILGANESWGVNVSCSGDPNQGIFHECPFEMGLNINYTCEVGAPYTVELLCKPASDHRCVYWSTTCVSCTCSMAHSKEYTG